MRVIFDVPTELAKGLLSHIASSVTEPEVIVKVRLLRRRDESVSPHIVWEVEFLPNNGGIYRRLLEGGDK